VDVLSTLRASTGVSGIAIAAVLAVIALVVVRGQPRDARWPFILLAIHVVAELSWPRLAAQSLGAKILHFVAVFALLASIARSSFLVFTGSKLVRRHFKPWPKILRDVVQVLLYFGVAMVALRAVGVEPSSLLTTSALLTAVLGLSMQETLGNLFAGLALQGQQSFAVGDWVRFADGPEGAGEVVEINWRATHLLTNNQVKIIVPNGVIARAVLKNYSRPTGLIRHDITLTAPYGASPERVREIVLAAIAGSRGVLDEPVPTLLVDQFTDIGVTYSLRYFIGEYGDREPIEGGVRQRIYYAFRREGIDFPFPHRYLLAPGLEQVVGHLTHPDTVAKPATTLDRRLARFEPFAGLDQKAIAELANESRLLVFSPGEAIIRQGEKGAELFGLERGEVEIVVKLKGDETVRVGTLGSGAIFGEAALLTGGARTATIVALTECELLAVPRAAFKKVIQARPELSEKLTSLLASRMDQLSQTINDAEAEGRLDGDRRSDLLIKRIKSFFGGGPT
jgi:small-conductance mechanosensitive channel/CRP-like cAMP-binding protein